MEIEISNLGFSYGRKDVLKGIDMKIKRGEFIGITGPTGSGKTTFAMCLNGLIPNSVDGRFSGRILISGMDTSRKKVPEISRKVGFVFQDPDSQIFNLSVRDEVAFGLNNSGKGDVGAKVRKALGMVGLGGMEDADPQKLSQGQKQKLCIASVLAMEPDIIVLDEPTSQLDSVSSEEVYRILRDLSGKGKTIILIDHNTDALVENAERILLFNGGTIAKDGPPAEVFRDTKLLERLGIAIPKYARLSAALRQQGIDADFITLEEAVKKIGRKLE